jgi:hypothetical protein
MEDVAMLRVAKSVILEIVSHINATKLSLSTMNRPLSLLVLSNVVSQYIILSEETGKLEVVDEIMRL